MVTHIKKFYYHLQVEATLLDTLSIRANTTTISKAKPKFFNRHKTFRKVFGEFSAGYFIFAGVIVGAAAGTLENLIPTWLFLSLLLISAIFGYVVTKQSESAMRAEFQEKIDDLEKRIQRLEEV